MSSWPVAVPARPSRLSSRFGRTALPLAASAASGGALVWLSPTVEAALVVAIAVACATQKWSATRPDQKPGARRPVLLQEFWTRPGSPRAALQTWDIFTGSVCFYAALHIANTAHRVGGVDQIVRFTFKHWT